MDAPTPSGSRVVCDLPQTLSADQQAALVQFERAFSSATLTALGPGQGASGQHSHAVSSAPGPAHSQHPAVVASQYRPAPARLFTPIELSQRLNYVTRQSKAHSIASHPFGAVVEYPQTGEAPKESIAHLFAVDPANFSNPRLDFQYSFDKKHGFHSGKTCGMLKDSSGNPVSCSRWHGTCSSIKTCSFFSSGSLPSPARISPAPAFNDADKQLFLKTFGFYCALLKHGCTFDSGNPPDDSPELSSDDEEANGTRTPADLVNDVDESLYRDIRAPARHRCPGRFTMYSKGGRYFISCSLRKPGARGHLFLHGIEQYDVDYLQALVSDDHDRAATWERKAAAGGYGPLARCTQMAPSSSQATCGDWHRGTDGSLQRGVMTQHSSCSASCVVYTPDDLNACPFVVVICTGPHSHPDPPPTRTPRVVRALFEEKLRSLDWQLASTTVRRLLLNQRFVQQLRDALGWQHSRHPTLSDLHPSLGNNDHAAYLIDEVRKIQFPHGTDFPAAVFLLAQQEFLEKRLRYVRAAEELVIGGKPFRYVVCMFAEQSEILRTGKRITVDTAFKRVQGWMELEFETWDDSSNRSISCGRVFLTALTAEAHFVVFKKIYTIVEDDCGIGLRFSYMHGTGWDTVAADEHPGEALAFGRFTAWIAQKTLPPDSVFVALSAYDHLSHFYMLCITHFKRNVRPFGSKVPQDVYEAMQSLSGTAAIVDLDATFSLIRSGGKKAAAWLSDKLKGSRWALRALNQPLSNIPLDKWKAAPRTTNGNEQAHHNVNLDGTHLALLAGIMHGSEFDARLLTGRRTVAETGVQSRYTIADEPLRAERNLKRQLSSRQHFLAEDDAEVAAAQDALDSTVHEIDDQVRFLEHAPPRAAQSSAARKRLRELLPTVPEQQQRLRKAARRGTGSIAVRIDTAPTIPASFLSSPPPSPAHIMPRSSALSSAGLSAAPPAQIAAPASHGPIAPVFSHASIASGSFPRDHERTTSIYSQLFVDARQPTPSPSHFLLPAPSASGPGFLRSAALFSPFDDAPFLSSLAFPPDTAVPNFTHSDLAFSPYEHVFLPSTGLASSNSVLTASSAGLSIPAFASCPSGFSLDSLHAPSMSSLSTPSSALVAPSENVSLASDTRLDSGIPPIHQSDLSDPALSHSNPSPSLYPLDCLRPLSYVPQHPENAQLPE